MSSVCKDYSQDICIILAVVVHAFDSSTQKAEAGGSLRVGGQPGLQSEYQDSQGYTEKPCLENKIKQNKQTKKYLYSEGEKGFNFGG